MVTVWSRRDMNELRLLQYVDAVPLASSYDTSVPGTHFNRVVRLRFARYTQPSRYDVQNLVTIRMNLPAMRRVMGHRHDADRHTIDPLRWTRFTRSGRNRQVSVDIEQMAGSVDSSDLAHGRFSLRRNARTVAYRRSRAARQAGEKFANADLVTVWWVRSNDWLSRFRYCANQVPISYTVLLRVGSTDTRLCRTNVG